MILQFAHLCAAAGGVQPGIESLSDNVLCLMRKGVRAAHNVLTLRLAKEFGITSSWNMITGFPGERAQDYFGIASLLPKLHHLEPPVGIGDFQLHRFSPFFETPEDLGVVLEGAHPTYEAVYPVGKSLLDRLVYRFSYRLIEPPDPWLNEAHIALHGAVEEWRRARARDARFTV